MTPEEFRKYGHELVDWIADYRANIADLPVKSVSSPGEIRRQIPDNPPIQGDEFAAIMRDFETQIVPGLTHWSHPSFFGFFPCNGLLASVLGDLASTGLGVLGLSWESSPALTELEEVAVDWMRQMLGLSECWHGVIQDTASTSTLLALICAREKVTDFCMTNSGLAGGKPLIVYTSQHSHSSVTKAALLAGFGKSNIHVIDHDADFGMNTFDLEQKILFDVQNGRIPCAIVATTGTTASTAFDPIEEIAKLATKYGVWLHVDAAMAGSAMILPECRYLWEGVELADSLVVNAHKWLGIAFDCSLYYVRDPEHLIRVMSTNPSYLQSSADGEVKNYRDWGIPLGRRFRALKLWFAIREQGVEELQRRIRRDLENAQKLEKVIRSTEGWEILNQVKLQTLCIRYVPTNMHVDKIDTFTRNWAARVNDSGKAYLTPALLDGKWIVRISIGSIPTEWSDIENLWEVIQQCVQDELEA